MLFVVIAHDIESSFCLPTPPHPSPLLSPPRLLASSSSRTFRHTGSTARLENDTILQEDRTLVKTASFVEQGYITSRVSPRALRSRFRERLKSKKKKTKRRESLSFHSFSLRSKGGFALSANRQSEERRLYTHRPVVTQRNA